MYVLLPIISRHLLACRWGSLDCNCLLVRYVVRMSKTWADNLMIIGLERKGEGREVMEIQCKSRLPTLLPCEIGSRLGV